MLGFCQKKEVGYIYYIGEILYITSKMEKKSKKSEKKCKIFFPPSTETAN
jgi:hypothetical protein